MEWYIVTLYRWNVWLLQSDFNCHFNKESNESTCKSHGVIIRHFYGVNNYTSLTAIRVNLSILKSKHRNFYGMNSPNQWVNQSLLIRSDQLQLNRVNGLNFEELFTLTHSHEFTYRWSDLFVSLLRSEFITLIIRWTSS